MECLCTFQVMWFADHTMHASWSGQKHTCIVGGHCKCSMTLSESPTWHYKEEGPSRDPR